MTKSIQLKDLASQIIKDNPTPELAKDATQLVFGSGDEDADVMFVGEAPGKKEDLVGEPFVGASGKLLDELLNSIKMNRKNVYITNIVKYRPKDNRDPSSVEKKEFWPYLMKQITIVKPKIIATLGRHSGQAFLHSLRIGADHGQIQNIEINVDGVNKNFNILPLYHPAAAMYNGSLRKTLFSDFQNITRNLKQLELSNTRLYSVGAEVPRTDFSSLNVAPATSRSEKITSETPQSPSDKQPKLHKSSV